MSDAYGAPTGFPSPPVQPSVPPPVQQPVQEESISRKFEFLRRLKVAQEDEPPCCDHSNMGAWIYWIIIKSLGVFAVSSQDGGLQDGAQVDIIDKVVWGLFTHRVKLQPS